MGRSLADITGDIKRYTDTFAGPMPLKSYPGSTRTWLYQPWDRKMVPTYILPLPISGVQSFVMPDFVQHTGVSNEVGMTQEWPAETLHAITTNVSENTPLIKKCWSELHKGGTPKSRWRDGELQPGGELEGKTLIICAPGPSLAGNLPMIERARAEDPGVRVMSINRAITAVKSDYIVLLERWCPVAWRTDAMFELQKDAKLIIAPQAHFDVPRRWKNKDNIYWGRIALGQYPDLAWLKMMDVAASTSAASAVRVGYELGAKKIVLCGFDYAVEFEPFPALAELGEQVHDGRAAALRILAEHVVKGDNDKALEFSKRVQKTEEELCKKDCRLCWKAGKFYFDQNFTDTEYYGKDSRFTAWFPVPAMSGKLVGTVYELMEYCAKLKCVLACIESGSDCTVINAGVDGILDWQGVDGSKPHPPMPLKEALAW
jgi:hypothetical protein